MSDTQVPPGTEWTSVATADGPMNVYRAGAGAGDDRAVVVLQEAFGVNEHIQDVTHRIAARGYLACAPDLFHRTGVATLDYDRHAEAMPLIGAIDIDAIVTDVQAVLTDLAGRDGIPTGRVAVVGFCFGGRAAFTAATTVAGLAATVVFYGPGVAAGPHAVLDRAREIDAPIMVHVGAEDPTIPPDQVTSIDDALALTDAPAVQHVYDGAGHAFACDARPGLYRRAAADLAWDRTFAFLGEHLPVAADC